MQSEPMPPGVIFVLVLIVLVSSSFVLLLIYKTAGWLGRRKGAQADYVTQPTAHQDTRGVRYLENYTAFGSENEPEPAPNLAVERQNLPGTPAFVLNPDELAAVARMIEHKTTAEKPTKASIIWAGFALKKGDSAKYKRASEIYDALFIIPPDPALRYADPKSGERVAATYPVSGRRT